LGVRFEAVLRLRWRGSLLAVGGAAALLATSGALAAVPEPPPSDQIIEATSPSGAVATYSEDVWDCAPDTGTTFPLGVTTVSCTATDPDTGLPETATFTVTVQDTTPPAVVPPGAPIQETADPAGAVVSFSASASDIVVGSLVPSCTPASGSLFPIGTTTVTCSATDAHNNAGSATFTVIVTLVDTTAPVVTAPADISATTTVAAPLAVTFTASANDNLDGPLTPTCTPATGSPFAIGTTTVTCSATDAHNNAGSATFTVTVTLVDTTPPVVSVPGSVIAEAVSANGAPVTFTATAVDNLDGTLMPACTPASGSIFAKGSSPVTCTAVDTRGNIGTATFTVTVADTAAPALAMPADPTVEANSALGSVVTFTVNAVDVADGPLPPASIRCVPASGSRFPLGRTQVQCGAADSSGNAATKHMTVNVVDSTAPVLTIPAPIALTAPASGLPATDPALARFLAGATAEDMVDSRPTVRHDAPAVFPRGQTTVTFVATDFVGNWEIGKSSVTLTAQPLAAPPPAAVDRIPPANVSALRAERGNARVRLRWRRPPSPDFDRVEILRSENQVGAAQTRVFAGSQTTFLDRALVNGTAYRYVVVSYDRTGNRSAGVAIVATPKATMLLRPLEGARISGAPTLTWSRARGATYYNLQLYRGVHKALTLWLKPTSFKLKRQWTFAGRRERLRPGFYRWYVWPGIGEPALGNYGPMLGESSFTIVR
jgi:hypothetical protein